LRPWTLMHRNTNGFWQLRLMCSGIKRMTGFITQPL